jgi:eukaryotic-like serine/threonine-protein kinase
MGFKPGEIVGDYEIIGLIGAGGQGEVYRVRNVISERVDAMKVVLENADADARLADRFLREIKLQARLQHPNIAPLYTAFRFENQLVMVMELVEGVTVAEMLTKGPLDPAQAAAIARQVLLALGCAHQHGVLHRDVKPENIIVAGDGVAKLTDFGIAKGDESERLTQTGAFVGSFHYMSPEQVRGLDLDGRSDVYSLGACVYEMVTGTVPFEGRSEWAIMRAHVKTPVKPPNDVNPSIGQPLSDVILKAMEKEREQRYQNADEFRAALESSTGIRVPVQTEERAPTPKSTAGIAPQVPDDSVWIRLSRNPWLVAAVIVIAALAAAGIRYVRGAGESNSIAVLPFVNVRGDPGTELLCDGLTEDLIENLSKFPRLSVRPFNSVAKYKQTDPQAAGHALNVHEVIAGRVERIEDDLSINVEVVDVEHNREISGYHYDRKMADLDAIRKQIPADVSQKVRLQFSR